MLARAFALSLLTGCATARNVTTRVVNGRTHYIGTLGGQHVVLLLSGYSMVNAAMTTQALLTWPS